MIEVAQTGAAGILIVTVATSLFGLYKMPQLIEWCLFRPYKFWREQQFPTMITSGFVHADIPHLLFNMFTFYFFAFALEEHIGTLSFLALYFIGLVGSHSCTLIKHRNNPGYASLGASGAVSAVLFAYIIYFPTATLMIMPIPIPIPAALFAVGYVGYSYWASRQSGGRINHDAHLCGAFSGLLFVAMTDSDAVLQIFTTSV